MGVEIRKGYCTSREQTVKEITDQGDSDKPRHSSDEL
jgi:hypothetical protein